MDDTAKRGESEGIAGREEKGGAASRRRPSRRSRGGLSHDLSQRVVEAVGRVEFARGADGRGGRSAEGGRGEGAVDEALGVQPNNGRNGAGSRNEAHPVVAGVGDAEVALRVQGDAPGRAE